VVGAVAAGVVEAERHRVGVTQPGVRGQVVAVEAVLDRTGVAVDRHVARLGPRALGAAAVRMRRVGSAKARGAADTKRPRCSLQATENCWGVNPSGPSPSGNGRTIGAAASTAARNDSSE